MKALFILLSVLSGALACAHDEGHGPKLTDVGKYGGVVSPVVATKEASLGTKAKLVYKAELVRTEDAGVKLYLYDKDMNQLDVSRFTKSAKGVVEIIKKKKTTKTPFELSLVDGAFTGSYPKPSSRPFNIDVTVK
ncbi:MAG: hypothetical protein HY537_13345, partial [Deltaproteobacteria bacterium]|nr:hypothetical protein [Deltaproteobacteria bacterium]